jgi:predicted S18 family serine protease
MKKYAKVINEETKLCEVGTGTNSAYYQSIGMVKMEVEQAYDGSWYLSGYAPEKPEPTIAEQNEAIRATREQLYIQTSDKLRNDYLEAVARDADNVEELKVAWLESKDKIRAENPYIVEEVSAEV